MIKEKIDQKWQFRGFAFPTTTPVPDQVFDELLYHLSPAEIVVLLYIIRRTYGFKKESDNISLSQMVNGIRTKDGRVLDRGTGLSKATVARVVRGLEAKHVIVRTRRRSEQRGDEPTTYQLNILAPVSQNETPPVSKHDTPVSHRRDTQQTVLQETVRQQQQQGAAQSEQGSSDVDVVALLTSKKIARKVAQDLARKFPTDYIQEKIDILDVLIDSHDPNAPTSPAGWLRKAIEDDYAPPDWYKTKAEREAAQIAQKRRQEQEAAEAEREREAERHKREQWRSMLIEQHRVSQKHLTLWAQTVSQVQESTVQENLKRWLGKTLLISQKDGTATIAVPYEYASQQMTNSAFEECQEILAQELGRSIDLRLEVIPYSHSE